MMKMSAKNAMKDIISMVIKIAKKFQLKIVYIWMKRMKNVIHACLVLLQMLMENAIYHQP